MTTARPSLVAALVSLQILSLSAVVLFSHAYLAPERPGGLALDLCLAASAAVLPLATPLRRWSHLAIMAALLASTVLALRLTVPGSVTSPFVQAMLVAALALIGGFVRCSLDRLQAQAAMTPSPRDDSSVPGRVWHDRLVDEFTRSRRNERPLSVVAFRFLPGDVTEPATADPANRTGNERWSLESVASSIAVHLRQADVLTCDAKEDTVWVLCIDAPTDDVAGFVARIRTELSTADSVRFLSATATFPTDALSPDALVDAVKTKLDRVGSKGTAHLRSGADVYVDVREAGKRSVRDGLRRS